MSELVVLVISCLLNGLLGFIVYSKNPGSATNKFFALLSSSFVVWSIADYFSLHPLVLSQLVWIRLVLFSAVFLCLSAYLTLSTFPDYEPQGRRRSVALLTLYSSAVMVLTLTPAVFGRLDIQNGQAVPQPNFGIVFFITLVVGLLAKGIINLVRRYRHSRGLQKTQLGLALFGLSGAFTLILFTNLFLVLVFRTSELVSFSSACTLVFSATFYYAIARRQLFDIRATTARLVAYVLSLGVVGGAYGLLIYALSSAFKIDNLNVERGAFIALTIVTALIYPRVRQFFAKITNSVLYQDAYDSQQLFNALNKTLVANIELDKLLQDSLQVISSTLKTEFGVVYLPFTGINREHVVGNLSKGLDIETIRAAYERYSVMPIVVTDLLPDSSGELVRALHKNDVAALANFAYQVGKDQRILGQLLLGRKKSGQPYSKQDVEVLEAITNEMVIAIQNALRFEEIQRFNATLQEEVDTATRKLKRQNKRLEELDDIKDDFISMASHQLRTPLTSVKGYLSMVLEGDAGKLTPTEKQMLKQAFASSQRMVFLITDLLNVSRLKTGKFVIDAAPTNLKDVVQEELDQLHETAEAKSLKLTFKAPQKFPELMLDDVKIRQVIMNFVDNAIYYTPSGGRIRVELEEKPTTVELRVVDNGIGVPRSEQHHLFTKFYRAANARKARPDGTGLGLFMAQKVIIAQGGSIIFHSKEGQGSTFGFSFSKSRLAVRKQPDPAGEPVKPAPEHATV